MLASSKKSITNNESEVPADGEAKGIRLPQPRTMLVAAAITGGIVAAGIVAYYYMRARRNNMTS